MLINYCFRKHVIQLVPYYVAQSSNGVLASQSNTVVNEHFVVLLCERPVSILGRKSGNLNTPFDKLSCHYSRRVITSGRTPVGLSLTVLQRFLPPQFRLMHRLFFLFHFLLSLGIIFGHFDLCLCEREDSVRESAGIGGFRRWWRGRNGSSCFSCF